MIYSKLRNKHQTFFYKGFETEFISNNLNIKFSFHLEPDINFMPSLQIPLPKKIDLSRQEIDSFVFNLGMIEMISYWKAACPYKIIVQAGKLTAEQVSWWQNLFINGLGEFFYKNSIDYTSTNFLKIESDSDKQYRLMKQKDLAGDLVLVGGGKDSVVTMGVLKEDDDSKTSLVLNSIPFALKTARQSGFQGPIVVKREIHSQLLELNQKGYLNGHTPFSAYLAFLSTFVAGLYGFKNVIVSNERSANKGNLVYKGTEVNHQYSKSYRFEKNFRAYCSDYLSEEVNYFSFLRPLYELQICKLFAQFKQYHSLFISCNVAQKTGDWCGECPKCAFIYLSLSPFIHPDQLEEIFGSNLFNSPKVILHLRKILGLVDHKPFECIGTEEEAQLALYLTLKAYKRWQVNQNKNLVNLEKEINLDTDKVKSLEKKIMAGWDTKNFLPEKYLHLLKEALNERD
jgi:hypothetical protein